MIDVVCALIIHKGEVLVMQHGKNSGHAFRWEFPGGKTNPGESEAEALVREIREELGIQIIPGKRLKEVEFTYPNKTIRLIPFLCNISHADVSLNEHNDFMWVKPSEILKSDLLEADRKLLGIKENFAELLDSCRENMQEGAQCSTPHDNG